VLAPERFFPQPQRDPGKSQLLQSDVLPLLWELLCPKELSRGLSWLTSPSGRTSALLDRAEMLVSLCLPSQSPGGGRQWLERWDMV